MGVCHMKHVRRHRETSAASPPSVGGTFGRGRAYGECVGCTARTGDLSGLGLCRECEKCLALSRGATRREAWRQGGGN